MDASTTQVVSAVKLCICGPPNQHVRIEALHLNAYIRITRRWKADIQSQVHTIDIGSVEVDEEFRRQGNCTESQDINSNSSLGTKFLQALEAVALDLKRQVYVECVNNPILRTLLEANGYTKENLSYQVDSNYWK